MFMLDSRLLERNCALGGFPERAHSPHSTCATIGKRAKTPNGYSTVTIFHTHTADKHTLNRIMLLNKLSTHLIFSQVSGAKVKI